MLLARWLLVQFMLRPTFITAAVVFSRPGGGAGMPRVVPVDLLHLVEERVLVSAAGPAPLDPRRELCDWTETLLVVDMETVVNESDRLGSRCRAGFVEQVLPLLDR